MSVPIDTSLANPGGASSTNQLTLAAERGTNSQKRINGFLKHPEVGYDHNKTGNPPQITLTAQNQRDEDVAMAVLTTPSAPELNKQGIIELKRFAAHPNRPPNTGSWLLSRACEWATLEGYDTFLTYAGITNENTGVMYDASNFTLDAVNEDADASGWNNRENRDVSGVYTRRRWTRDLGPDHNLENRRYDGRSNTTLSAFASDEDDTVSSVSDLVLTREAELERGATFEECADDVSEAVCDKAVRWEGVTAIFGMRHYATGRLAGYIVVEDIGRDGRDATGVNVTDLDVVGDAVAYPVQALRWLMSRVRRWAALHGHKRLAVTPLRHSWESVYAGADFTKTQSGAWVTILSP